MNRILILTIGFLLSCLGAGAQAQTTSTLSNLFLSPGGEIDLRLFGAVGGPGTNGTNSDRFAVQNQFSSTNPSSAATYTIGFTLGDDIPLVPGTNFTLVTFTNTNFVDASKFRAAVRGDRLQSIEGSFLLVPPDSANGQPGSLVFTLGRYATVPEPASLMLMALFLGGHAVWRAGRHTRCAIFSNEKECYES
jgi:hypothetical protein